MISAAGSIETASIADKRSVYIEDKTWKYIAVNLNGTAAAVLASGRGLNRVSRPKLVSSAASVDYGPEDSFKQ
jgi:hypothetical protein